MIRADGADNNIYKNFEVLNTTFIILPGTGSVLCSGTGGMTQEMKMSWTNCTFITSSDTQLFGATVGAGGKLTHVVESCLFGGENGAARGYQTGSGDITYRFTNNYRTLGWSFGGYTFPVMPAETVSHFELFVDPASYDFTIKDVNSEVYKNAIGDPRWIRE